MFDMGVALANERARDDVLKTEIESIDSSYTDGRNPACVLGHIGPFQCGSYLLNYLCRYRTWQYSPSQNKHLGKESHQVHDIISYVSGWVVCKRKVNCRGFRIG